MTHATVRLTDSARRAYYNSGTQYTRDRVLYAEEGRVIGEIGRGILEVEFSLPWIAAPPFLLLCHESEVVFVLPKEGSSSVLLKEVA